MKLLSWNVNGIRSVVRKGFAELLHAEKPDVWCVQETKASPEQVEPFWGAGYHAYWNSAEKKGYSGVLILSRKKPRSVREGIGQSEHDREGRVLTAEYADFYLVNVYVPNAKRGLERLPYRQQWDAAFLTYLRELELIKPVVVCGDFNVAHEERDLANPKQNTRTHGFTREERDGFDKFIRAGLIDTFREFESGSGHYTWWSVMTGARARNIGWRIDYFLISAALRPRLRSATIRPEVMGSDHCPVGIELR